VGEFAGVEHRLEPVASIDDVLYVNDSQGTQPDAVIAALHSFEPPLVLICGGRGKGLSLDELAEHVARRAAAVVLIGETAGEMERAFGAAGAARLEHARDMDAAVVRADEIARELLAVEGKEAQATVLLSPAAASFDMFVDYADRGRAFKDAVRALGQRRALAGETR
jgi:UDP-N-acetylmuramoylalanine--D-glutamate ligase